MTNKFRLLIAGMFCLSAGLYATQSQAEVPVIDESFNMPSTNQNENVTQSSQDSDDMEEGGNEMDSRPRIQPISDEQAGVRSQKTQPRVTEETSTQIEAMRQEIAELRDQVERDAHLLQQMNQQKASESMAVTPSKAIVPSVATAGPASAAIAEVAASKKASSPSAEASQPSSATPSPSEAAELNAYQKGYDAIKAKDFDRAQKAFSSYLNQYSDGKYAGNAHYWLGEIYLHQNALSKAANEFQTVVSDSKNPKYPDAMLKLGLVYAQQGNYPAARKQFTQVKQKFSGSTEATLAETKLQEMTQQGY